MAYRIKAYQTTSQPIGTRGRVVTRTEVEYEDVNGGEEADIDLREMRTKPEVPDANPVDGWYKCTCWWNTREPRGQRRQRGGYGAKNCPVHNPGGGTG